MTIGKEERFLEFTSMEPGQPMTGRCCACRRVFRIVPKGMERADDMVLRMRAEFALHDCNEDTTEPQGEKIAG